MADKPVSFTARDLELLAKALTCTTAPIAIDYKKFAEVAAFKNANSAKASWHGIKKKIDKATEGGAGMVVPGSEGGEAGKKRKANAVEDGVEEEEEEEEKSAAADGKDESGGEEGGEKVAPAKKAKKPRVSAAQKKKKKAQAEEAEAGVGAEEVKGEEEAAPVKDEGGEDE